MVDLVVEFFQIVLVKMKVVIQILGIKRGAQLGLMIGIMEVI